MAIVNLQALGDAFVIHFEAEQRRINAYTLASAIVAIADAAKAANADLNPGYDVEVVVEAIGPGSFRAAIRAVYSNAQNLFSNRSIRAVALSIIASYIYEHTLSQSGKVDVTVNTNEVVIVSGNDRVVVPRTVHDASNDLSSNSRFVAAVSRFAQATANDEHVSGLAFVPSLDSPHPGLILDKEHLIIAFPNPEDYDPTDRVVTEKANLAILKAVMERGRRKWEFAWRGVKISAPINDDGFFDQFDAHRITIGPGDELEVDLAIRQAKDVAAGVYTNKSYAVVKVYRRISAIRQSSFNDP